MVCHGRCPPALNVKINWQNYWKQSLNAPKFVILSNKKLKIQEINELEEVTFTSLLFEYTYLVAVLLLGVHILYKQIHEVCA